MKLEQMIGKMIGNFKLSFWETVEDVTDILDALTGYPGYHVQLRDEAKQRARDAAWLNSPEGQREQELNRLATKMDARFSDLYRWLADDMLRSRAGPPTVGWADRILKSFYMGDYRARLGLTSDTEVEAFWRASHYYLDQAADSYNRAAAARARSDYQVTHGPWPPRG